MYNFIYSVGDLVACPRKHVQDLWGICIVVDTGCIESHLPNGKNFYYYTVYSPVREQTVQMPAVVLEESWYIPGNEKKV